MTLHPNIIIPKISIIVPVYKAEKYIENCIKSIQHQIFEDWELILVDDGSPDSSGNICDNFAVNDKRIKVIHQQNQGPAVARNVGIDAATGDYIGFVDSDDTIEPEMYSTMYALAEKVNAEVVICNYKEISVSDESSYSKVIIREHKLPVERLLSKAEIENKILFSYFQTNAYGIASLWNKLYRLSFINLNNLRLDVRRVRAEDWQFNMELFQLADKVISTNKPFYNYLHQNPHSIMASYRSNQFELFLYSEELLNNLKKKYSFQIDETEKNNKFIYDSFMYILQIIHNENPVIGKNKMLEILSNLELLKALSNHDKKTLPFHFKILTTASSLKWYNLTYMLFKLWSKRFI